MSLLRSLAAAAVFFPLSIMAADPPKDQPFDVIKFSGLPPEQAAREMTTRPGFSVKLFAGEPDVVGSSRVDLQACKLEYSIVSPK